MKKCERKLNVWCSFLRTATLEASTTCRLKVHIFTIVQGRHRKIDIPREKNIYRICGLGFPVGCREKDVREDAEIMNVLNLLQLLFMPKG